MISLIPCYSLEDFSLYRQSSEVDEIFSAWSALYHPALVDHFKEAPRWEAAGSPSTGKTRRLIVVPPCAEYLVSRSWLKSAESEGAVVIRDVADRDEILKVAFEKLGISSRPDVPTDGVSNSTSEIHYDDDAESFLAVGLGCLLEELLTRKLRYMSNLDQVSFNTRVVDAARAHMQGDAEEREKNLQKAFDLLTQSKEYFFPTATKFLDLTWVDAEDLAEALPNELKLRCLRKEKTNLVLPVPILKRCQSEFPETFSILQEEVKVGRVTLIGGDEWEGPLYLQSPLEIARTLQAGRNVYLEAFGVAPTVFGRQEAGYAQILPQLLKLSGYKGALSRTGDGWSLLEKPSDRSQFRWQGRDGSVVATFCKKKLDASSSEEILQLPDRIGNSYYSDDASAVVFEHRPSQASRWLRDIMRIDRYSPVLGKFYDFNDYLRVTEGSGNKEKFVKDQFKTNFLTRSVKRGRKDVVSFWPCRLRLGQTIESLKLLETIVRTTSLKHKPTAQSDKLFDEYLTRSNALSKNLRETLHDLDSQLLPVETKETGSKDETPYETQNASSKFDLERRCESLEVEKEKLLEIVSQFLAYTNASTDKERNDETSRGSLFINVAPTPKEVAWEIRSNSTEAFQNVLTVFQELFVQASGIKTRVFSDDAEQIAQYYATLPSGGTLWIPQLSGVEYKFLERPNFEYESSEYDKTTLQNDEPLYEKKVPYVSGNDSRAQTSAGSKGTFLKKLASKLRGEVPNSASNTSEDESKDRELAEYVVKRYSATEIEKYYRLRNDYFEIRIDPTTGTVRRLTTFNSNATFSNGVLRQPSLGNRVAWDLAFKLTKTLRLDDRRPSEDPCFEYTTSAADKIVVLESSPSVGRIQTRGRMVAPNGDVAGKFVQTLTIRLKSKIIDVDVEIEPFVTPDDAPWDSYYACRFAWKDALADVRGGVGASLIGTTRDYLQAPECVDIRSEDAIGITILSEGLPFYKKVADARMDAILIPFGETKRRFHFAVGIDLDDPHTAALSYLSPAPFRLNDVPRPKRIATSFVSSTEKNVHILEEEPICSQSSESSNEGRDGFIGIKLVLLETHSAKTTTTLRSFLPVDRIEALDFTGAVLKDTFEFSNASAIELEFKPRQIRILNLYFKNSSLK